MSTNRLSVLSIAALVFAVYETWVAYADQSEGANIVWAVFSWICVLFVAGLWWESLRGK
jgi:hypothetical protein